MICVPNVDSPEPGGVVGAAVGDGVLVGCGEGVGVAVAGLGVRVAVGIGDGVGLGVRVAVGVGDGVEGRASAVPASSTHARSASGIDRKLMPTTFETTMSLASPLPWRRRRCGLLST